MDENPYKSPKDVETAQHGIGTGLLAGVIRGARFGGLVGLAIGVTLTVIALILPAFVPAIAPREFGTFSALGAIGGIALCGFYGALTGALVNGLAWALKRK